MLNIIKINEIQNTAQSHQTCPLAQESGESQYFSVILKRHSSRCHGLLPPPHYILLFQINPKIFYKETNQGITINFFRKSLFVTSSLHSIHAEVDGTLLADKMSDYTHIQTESPFKL